MGGQSRSITGTSNLHGIETFDIVTRPNSDGRTYEEKNRDLKCLRDHFPDELYSNVGGKGTGGIEGNLGYFCSGAWCQVFVPDMVNDDIPTKNTYLFVCKTCRTKTTILSLSTQ